MYLHIHSDASYLSEAKARSRVGGTFFLSDRSKDTHASHTFTFRHTTPRHHCTMVSFTRSAASCETQWHPQQRLNYSSSPVPSCTRHHSSAHSPSQNGPSTGPHTIQTDNACASGIANKTVTQCRSKAIDRHAFLLDTRPTE
jgi:hypothetical protein